MTERKQAGCWSVCLFLCMSARMAGWRVTRERVAGSGSIYVKLRRGVDWVWLRVSDHRSHQGMEFSGRFLSVRFHCRESVKAAVCWLVAGVQNAYFRRGWRWVFRQGGVLGSASASD